MSSKIIKITALITLTIIVVFAVLFFILTQLIDPNHFRPQINQFIKDKTGRQVTIENISWSFFPKMGLKIKNIVLSNPEGKEFKTPFFAKIDNAVVSVHLLPLILKKIDMGSISLEGTHLIFVRNSQSQENWAGLLLENATKAEEKPTKVGDSDYSSAFKIYTSSISISNAQIEWWDQTTGQHLYLKKLNLQSTGIAPNRPFTVNLKTQFSQADSHFITQSKFSTLADLDLEKGEYKLENTSLDLVMIPETDNHRSSIKKLPISINADILIDQKAQTIKADNLSINIANIQGKGSAQGSGFSSEKFQLRGVLNILSFSPREAFGILGYNLALKKSDSLSKAGGSVNFLLTHDTLALNQIKVGIDNTHIDGNILLKKADQNTLSFNIHLDTLPLDDYSYHSSDIPPSSKPALLSSTQTPQMPVVKQSSPEPAQNNLSFLEQLIIANSTLKADQLSLGKLEAKQFSAEVKGKAGIIQLAPITMQLYDGKASGGVTLNVKQPTPQYTLNLNLDSVDIEKMLLANTGSAKIQGKLGLNTNLTLQGNTKTQLINTLQGKGVFSLVSGRIKALDAGQILSLASSIMNKQPKPKTSSFQETTFDKITGNFLIEKGYINNNALQLSSPTISAKGSGTINLNTEALDYLLKITGIKSVALNNGKESAALYDWFVPVRITGTLDNPIVRPDYEGISKQIIRHQIKRKLLKKLDDNTRKAVGGFIDKILP